MAQIKKNQLNQILFLMVDGTDFASPETGITVSGKYFGVNHGVSTATSTGNTSKVISEVGSGLYRLTAKASETNFDFVTFHLTGAGCAAQNLTFQCVDSDDSDIMSAISIGNSRALRILSDTSDIYSMVVSHSNILSYLSNMQSNLSGITSDILSATRGNSDALSDLLSRLNSASFLSDIASHVWAAKYTANSAASSFGSLMSDIFSRVAVTQSAASDTLSMLTSVSDIVSNINSMLVAGTFALGNSNTSDVASAVWAHTIGTRVDSRVLRILSDASDTLSAARGNSDALSDILSRLNSASFLSDIASHVWAAKYTANSAASSFGSLLSDIYSRVALTQSAASDTLSMLTVISDTTSNINSMLVAGTFTLGSSNLSDIGSRVWSEKYTAHSLASSFGSLLSDIYSRAGGAVTVSDISDIASAVWANTIGARVDSRLRLVQSDVSDTYSILLSMSDTLSNVNSMLIAGTFVLGASNLSDIGSAVWATKYTAHSLASSFGSLMSDIYSRAGGAVTTSDISDIASAVWAHTVGTRVDSRVLKVLSDTSDTLSAARGNSDALSDILSRLNSASFLSDIASHVWAAKYTANSGASSFGSLISDIFSRVALTQSAASDTLSMLTTISDVTSNINSMLVAGTFALGNSNTSDVASAVWAHTIGARVDSRLLKVLSDTSDVNSMLTAGTFALGASNLSDIGSRVWADTIGARVDSRLRLVQSDASDTLSAVRGNSDALSDLLSRLNSASFLSDIASHVWAAKYTGNSGASSFGSLISDIYSRLALTQSNVSDTYSMLSDLYSDFQSRVPKRVATDSQLSNVHSDILSALANISVTLTASDISDIASAVAASVSTLTTSNISDIASAVWAAKYTVHSNASSFGSLMSDIFSRVALTQSVASDTYSMLANVSDILSNVNSMLLAGTFALGNSNTSDLASAVWAHTIGTRVDSRLRLVQSDASDILSLITTTGVQLNNSSLSDIRSAIAAGTFTLTTSDISDIASRVWSEKYHAHSLASSFGSLFSVLATDTNSARSLASDANSFLAGLSSLDSNIYSMLSDFYSDFQSRVPKRVATDSQLSDVLSDIRSLIGVGVEIGASSLSDIRSAITATAFTLSASDISDIGSQVWANTIGARVDSRLRLVQSTTSDIYSLLSDVQSDFQSRIPKRVATDSQISGLESDLRSYLAGLSAMTSDIYSVVSDLQSDFQSRVPKRVATDSQLSNLHSNLAASIQDVYSSLSDIGSDIISNIQSQFANIRIKKNQPLNNFEFAMVSSSDHVSFITGLSVIAERSLDGGAFSSMTNSVVEVGGGVYKINLSAADTNANIVSYKFSAASADTIILTIITND